MFSPLVERFKDRGGIRSFEIFGESRYRNPVGEEGRYLLSTTVNAGYDKDLRSLTSNRAQNHATEK